MNQPPRIALLTLGSAASSGAVAAFLRSRGAQVVLLGLSNPYRRGTGGALGQAWRHLRRSGPRMLAYLLVNMALPRLATALARGRGSLTALARERGIPVAAVEDVNGPAFHDALRAARPDLILTFHFDGILSAATIALAPGGGINVHPSLLPRHRGPIPTFWAGAAGEPHGITIHRLVPRIDAGPILAQRSIPLPPGTSASSASRLLHGAALPLLDEILTLPTREIPPAEPLPYCPFPDRAALRAARRRGVRLVDAGDVRVALRARV